MNESQTNLWPTRLLIALAVYITSLIAANTLGIKLMPFLFGTHLSVAVFSFPIVFLMTDIVGEIYGKRVARQFVIAGFVSTALFVFYTILSNLMPWSTDKATLWAHGSYDVIFGVTARISIASLLAFAIAEYQDVIAFFFFKKKFGSDNFWIRSNLSNLWSQFLDTVIFTVVAFAGIYPWSTMLSIIIPWWLYKVLMGFLYTPLSYLGLKLLKQK
ncbi:MAG: VUT family protein [Candidatus Taylorbacteria bacterium]|nr:VUT family protein [Candidatus Taylorbacteria bacterium]